MSLCRNAAALVRASGQLRALLLGATAIQCDSSLQHPCLPVRTPLAPPPAGEKQLVLVKALNEFDPKATDWRKRVESQRGAVLATETKNNKAKIAGWTAQALLAGADLIKLGYVSRVSPKSNAQHVVSGRTGRRRSVSCPCPCFFATKVCSCSRCAMLNFTHTAVWRLQVVHMLFTCQSRTATSSV